MCISICWCMPTFVFYSCMRSRAERSATQLSLCLCVCVFYLSLLHPASIYLYLYTTSVSHADPGIVCRAQGLSTVLRRRAARRSFACKQFLLEGFTVLYRCLHILDQTLHSLCEAHASMPCLLYLLYNDSFLDLIF